MILHILTGAVGLAVAMRLRLVDPIIQPIQIDPITVEDSDPFGNSQATTTTPSPYMTNPPSMYSIEPVLEPTLGQNELSVNATSDDMDICKRLTGKVRVDAGCMGRQ